MPQQPQMSMDDLANYLHQWRQAQQKDSWDTTAALQKDIAGLKEEISIGNIMQILNSGVALEENQKAVLQGIVSDYVNRTVKTKTTQEELGNVFK